MPHSLLPQKRGQIIRVYKSAGDFAVEFRWTALWYRENEQGT